MIVDRIGFIGSEWRESSKAENSHVIDAVNVRQYSLSRRREALLRIMLHACDRQHVLANPGLFDDWKPCLVAPDSDELDDAESVLEGQTDDVTWASSGLNVLRAAFVQEQANQLVHLDTQTEKEEKGRKALKVERGAVSKRIVGVQVDQA